MDYTTKRANLIQQAENFINNNQIDEANEIMAQVKKLDEEHEAQTTAQANLNALNGINAVKNPFMQSTAMNADDNTTDDIYNTVEYRKAFMSNVIYDTPIPEKFKNDNTVTTSSGAGTIVPTILYEKIVTKLESIGEIYARVFKGNYPTGISIPTASILPVATWTDEDKGAETQKTDTSNIVFAGYKLECKCAFSLFITKTALEIFESQFVNMISNAMIKALEKSIISGTGTGSPKGILAETPVDGQTVNVAKTDKLTYKLVNDIEATLPAAYNGAEYLMTKKTFFKLNGITDDNGQPIARLTADGNGKPNKSLLGRNVIYSDGYMKDYADTVTEDTTFAVLVDLSHYLLNEVMGITLKKYIDEDNDNLIIKATMLADGKLIDKNSLVKVIKKTT